MGSVEYTANITLLSRSVDTDLFLAFLVLTILLHIPRLRLELFSDAAGIFPIMGGVAGLGLFLFRSPLALPLIGLSALSIIVVDISRLGRRSFAEYALVVTSITAVVAVLGALGWIANGFISGAPLEGGLWTPAKIDLQLLGLVYTALPELVILFFFSWVIRLLLPPHQPFLGQWARLSEESGQTPQPLAKLADGPWPLLLLGAGVLLAVFVGVYPYLPAINPTGMFVGVDVNHCYSLWVNNLPGNTICGPLGSVFGNERAGALWALQGMAFLMGSSDVAVKSSFGLFSILLVISTYVLVLEGTEDRFLAGVAALLTGISTQVLVGINAGILANWLAWPFVNFFFALLFRGMKTQRFVYAVPSFALFAAILFIHPWTWALVLVVLVIYLTVLLLQSGAAHELSKRRFEAVLLGALVGLGLASDALKSFLPVGSALVVAVQTIQPYFSFSNIPIMAETIKTTFQIWVGGAMSNPLWYILGTVGMLAIPSLRNRFGMLLATWVAAEGFGIVTIAGPTIQSRLITDVPVQIFAAVGIVAILNYLLRGLQDGTKSGIVTSKLLVAMTLISVVGLFLGFALEIAGFLYA